MSRFGRALGSGIAKGLCDFDRSLRDEEPDMYLMSSWERQLQKDVKKEAEQKKRDAAYKRMFGCYPNETWGGNGR